MDVAFLLSLKLPVDDAHNNPGAFLLIQSSKESFPLVSREEKL